MFLYKKWFFYSDTRHRRINKNNSVLKFVNFQWDIDEIQSIMELIQTFIYVLFVHSAYSKSFHLSFAEMCNLLSSVKTNPWFFTIMSPSGTWLHIHYLQPIGYPTFVIKLALLLCYSIRIYFCHYFKDYVLCKLFNILQEEKLCGVKLY